MDKTHKHIVIDARIRRSTTGRYVDRLLEHLQDIDRENRYSVLLMPDDDWRPKAENFTTVSSPFKQFSFNPMDQIKFARQLKSLKPDLVHFPMNQQPIFYRGKIVTTTMDLTMLRFTRPGKAPLPVFWLKMLGYRFLFWYSNRKSERIITISRFVKDDLIKHYPFTDGKVSVTYCASEPPLEAKAKKPVVLKDVRKNKTGKFLLYAGSAFPHKNLETLIKAFEKLHSSDGELKLILTGKREYYFEQLEKFADQSPARNSIIFTGFVADEELKWLYKNASVYAFPSLSEGFGLPGLEAMAHGCPVASSNATCLPEIYGDAAIYFDPNDAEDMAGTINELLNDDELRGELIENGYQRLERYSWDKMARETLSIYQSVLKN